MSESKSNDRICSPGKDLHHFQLTSLQPKPPHSRRPAAISCSLRRCLSATIRLVCIVHLWWEGGLLQVQRYSGPPWRLIGLLFLRLWSQSDNCFSEQLFEMATPRNPQRIDNTRPPLSVFWRAEQFDVVTGISKHLQEKYCFFVKGPALFRL